MTTPNEVYLWAVLLSLLGEASMIILIGYMLWLTAEALRPWLDLKLWPYSVRCNGCGATEKRMSQPMFRDHWRWAPKMVDGHDYGGYVACGIFGVGRRTA